MPRPLWEKGYVIGRKQNTFFPILDKSAHRYIIQDRLKLAGAWWTDENAYNMLALRTLRANNAWESYWDRLNHQAAMN